MSLQGPETTRTTRAANRRFYDALWSAGYLVSPQRFNTWADVSVLAGAAVARLEVGPGLRPRLPVAGTHFVDVSAPALGRLRERGGITTLGDVTALPFPDAAFDLVCAFDIVEHVEDDRRVFHELSRVARSGATVMLSVPLHPARWTGFDTLVGHVRRYEPAALLALLEEHGLTLERTAVFGMEPRSRWLLDFAVWGLTKRRVQAMRWYNAVILPVGLFLQRRLEWAPGLIDVGEVGELLLACRRTGTGASSVVRNVPADESRAIGPRREQVSGGRARSPARVVFLAWSATLGVLAAWAAERGQLGFATIGVLAAAWYVVATVGVFFPWLEMYGPIVLHGSSGRGRVALTFDDGPHPVTTRRVLAALAGTGHRATFFVLGEKARRHPDVLREIHAAGHTIGLHGDRHDRLHAFRMPWRVRRELVSAARAVEAATGVRPRLFRPPLGHTSVTTTWGARLAGMTFVGWSTRGLDGIRGRSPDAVVARVDRMLTDGAIVMLHDASEHDDFEPASVRGLPQLLHLLERRGWKSVGVETLLDGSEVVDVPAAARDLAAHRGWTC